MSPSPAPHPTDVARALVPSDATPPTVARGADRLLPAALEGLLAGVDRVEVHG